MKKVIIGIVAIVAIVFLITQGLLTGTSEPNKNNEVNGVKIEARVSNDDRNPIIQTFTLEDYNNKTEEEKLEIQEEISEKIEGDIPRVN